MSRKKQDAQPAEGAPAPSAPAFARRIRHWKDQFDRHVDYLWARAIVTDGVRVKPGDPVDAKQYHWAKLRRLWEMGWVVKAVPYGAAKGA